MCFKIQLKMLDIVFGKVRGFFVATRLEFYIPLVACQRSLVEDGIRD